MNVVFATHGASVAESLSHLINCAIDIARRLALGRRRPDFAQRHRREYGSTPGTKILCAYLVAADLAQVFVDIVRGNALTLAIAVDILE